MFLANTAFVSFLWYFMHYKRKKGKINNKRNITQTTPRLTPMSKHIMGKTFQQKNITWRSNSFIKLSSFSRAIFASEANWSRSDRNDLISLLTIKYQMLLNKQQIIWSWHGLNKLPEKRGKKKATTKIMANDYLAKDVHKRSKVRYQEVGYWRADIPKKKIIWHDQMVILTVTDIWGKDS